MSQLCPNVVTSRLINCLIQDSLSAPSTQPCKQALEILASRFSKWRHIHSKSFKHGVQKLRSYKRCVSHYSRHNYRDWMETCDLSTSSRRFTRTDFSPDVERPFSLSFSWRLPTCDFLWIAMNCLRDSRDSVKFPSLTANLEVCHCHCSCTFGDPQRCEIDRICPLVEGNIATTGSTGFLYQVIGSSVRPYEPAEAETVDTIQAGSTRVTPSKDFDYFGWKCQTQTEP